MSTVSWMFPCKWSTYVFTHVGAQLCCVSLFFYLVLQHFHILCISCVIFFNRNQMFHQVFAVRAHSSSRSHRLAGLGFCVSTLLPAQPIQLQSPAI